MARQLAFELPFTPAFGADDYLVGAANERAFALIEAWPAWPDALLRLEGPAGSGKSHLAAIWAEQSGGPVIRASSVVADAVPALADEAALAIEDIDRGVGDERALFHLINLARERGSSLLLTGAKAPDACGLLVPDLVSRLRLAPSVALEAPDEALLRAVLVKLFHDRQVMVDAAVIDFVASRIERSFAAAVEIVAELDREALSRGRRVTRPIAANILALREPNPVGDNGIHPPVTWET
ncbi:DnaA ATPase domain-containing protein [Enterovirga rhinocerotis]|nr:DnaA/Hda family protein [Enterovirga rhinocerotis]